MSHDQLCRLMMGYCTEQAGIFRVRGDTDKWTFFLRKHAEFSRALTRTGG